ncbi:anthrone oxygenase family protein [Winogradskyella poriferorum]|uniref:DUF1772 domain-containing protein n=1 Tax=Winogradskyella poriferorum TaxID=307627 RepID=A0ABU7W5B1_9FLAO|tara:strand:+ start:25517 stop:26023 length:507 start_codon:yes stop_codon:yes gene_type:complete
MNVSIENIAIIVFIILTGLSAGLCFTWSNSITSGLGRLDDLGYLSAFQQINRTILNPTFFIVFFGPFFLSIINIYVFRNAPSDIKGLLIAAAVIYTVGVVVVTIFGNVPLNELVDKTNLNTASAEDLKTLRATFETKWNQFHTIRTVTSIIAFVLLIISTMQIAKNNL